MTFCQNCGSNLEAGAIFCTNCGTTTGVPTPNAPPPHTVPVSYPQPPAAQNGKMMRAIVAALVVLMVATMLQGWFNLHIDMSPRSTMGSMMNDLFQDIIWDLGFVPPGIAQLMTSNLNYSMTIYELGNFAGAARWFADLMQPALMMMDPFEMMLVSPIIDTINTFALSVTIIRVLQVASILSLAAFVFLLLVDSKIAGTIGQLASLVTFLTSLVFAIAMFVVNANLQRAMMPMGFGGGGFGGAMGMFMGIGAGPSVWVWITMILSIMAFLLISVRKSVFKGGS